jgi:hypothetical protein
LEGHKYQNLNLRYEYSQSVPGHPSGSGKFSEGKTFGRVEGKMVGGARGEVELL